MNECLVAIAFGDYRFRVQDVVSAAARAWPGARFFNATGLEDVSEGQLQISLPSDRDPEVLAAFLPGGKGISLDGTVEGMAHFIAWLTSAGELPGDESVVVLGWTPEGFPLRPGLTADELITAFDG